MMTDELQSSRGNEPPRANADVAVSYSPSWPNFNPDCGSRVGDEEGPARLHRHHVYVPEWDDVIEVNLTKGGGPGINGNRPWDS